MPTWQSSGVYPADPDAVDMVNVDEFYDRSAMGFVRGAVADRVPFFFYFASHHTHAPQFAACQTTGGPIEMTAYDERVDAMSSPTSSACRALTHISRASRCCPGDATGDDAQLANCSTPRGLFGDSLGLLDRSVRRAAAT